MVVVVVVHVLRSSLSLSRLVYCGGKKMEQKKGISDQIFLFMFRVLVKKKQTSLSRVIKVFRLTFE